MAKFTTNSPYINRNGAPTLQKQVEAWFFNNPNGNISQCAKALNISRPTARKWMPEQMKLQKLASEQERLQEKKKEHPGKLKRIWEIIKE